MTFMRYVLCLVSGLCLNAFVLVKIYLIKTFLRIDCCMRMGSSHGAISRYMFDNYLVSEIDSCHDGDVFAFVDVHRYVLILLNIIFFFGSTERNHYCRCIFLCRLPPFSSQKDQNFECLFFDVDITITL